MILTVPCVFFFLSPKDIPSVIHAVYNYDAIVEARRKEKEERKRLRDERRREKERKRMERIKRRTARIARSASLELPLDEPTTLEDAELTSEKLMQGDDEDEEDPGDEIPALMDINEDEESESDKTIESLCNEEESSQNESDLPVEEQATSNQRSFVPLPPPPRKGILVTTGFGLVISSNF